MTTLESVSNERLAELIDENSEETGPAEAWGAEVVSMAAELQQRRASSGDVTSGEVVTKEMVEVAAKFIASDLFRYSWEGLGSEGRITDRGFKPIIYSMDGGMQLQGRQDDLRDLARALLTAALSSLHAQPEGEAVWGYGDTVGNLIAQLRTLDPAMPIHAGFHADLRGKRQAMVRGLTLSRERVNGRKIETGNEDVPYSAVIWAAPQSEPQETGSREAVAWLHKLIHPKGYDFTWEVTESPEHSFDDVEFDSTYTATVTPLIPLSQLQAVERERDALAKVIDPNDNRPALMARIIMSSIERLVRAETAEASLAAARELVRQFLRVMDEDVFDELAADTVHTAAHKFLTALDGSNGE